MINTIRWLLPLAAIVSAILMGVTIKMQHEQIIGLTAERDNLAATYQTLATEHARNEAAYRQLSATKLQIADKAHQARRTVKQAPKSDDAPLAPVLKKALEAIND